MTQNFKKKTHKKQCIENVSYVFSSNKRKSRRKLQVWNLLNITGID